MWVSSSPDYYFYIVLPLYPSEKHCSWLHTDTYPTHSKSSWANISISLLSLILTSNVADHTSRTLTPNLNLSSFSGTNASANTFVLARSSGSSCSKYIIVLPSELSVLNNFVLYCSNKLLLFSRKNCRFNREIGFHRLLEDGGVKGNLIGGL